MNSGINLTRDQINAFTFYDANYNILGNWIIRPGKRRYLGDKAKRICRFCKSDNATFRNDAHVIPQLLGNKTLMSFYECDACNKDFGDDIENHLGNWTKPSRTLSRIRGQNGCPVLKREGDNGWRIEGKGANLHITANETGAPFTVDEANHRVAFRLPRDPYIPLAVFKAFVRIGLTLMPDVEVHNFEELVEWVRNKNHTFGLMKKCFVARTFHPGPMSNSLLFAMLLRRKSPTAECPYIFLVLSYGNEVFQLPIPCRKFDSHLDGKLLDIPTFPSPGSRDPAKYGPPVTEMLDLTGIDEVRGDVVHIDMQFEESKAIDNASEL